MFTTETMKILTLNMFIRPPFISTSYGDAKDKRLEMLKGLLKEYDVVCLQEMFGSFSTRRKKLIAYAQSIGFAHYATGPSSNIFKGKFVDSGLLILSKFKLLDHVILQYTNGIKSDNLSAKGAICIKVEVLGQVMAIFTTHLQASYTLNLTESSDVVRIRQLQLHELNAFIRKTTQLNDHIIVTGDFNINARATLFEYERLFRHIAMKDASLDVLKEHPITFYPWQYRFKGVPSPKEQECLDYIFYQNLFISTVQVLKDPLLSDHFGLEMTCQLTE